MKLKPSEIFYSQDSIKNYFSVGHKTIGETLDDICEERLHIEDIPRIYVAWLGDKWVTCDNRRLWVFRMLEPLDMCDEIHVNVRETIPSNKLTSVNGGVDISIRGDPGGHWYKNVVKTDDDDSTSDDDYYQDDIDKKYEYLIDKWDVLDFK